MRLLFSALIAGLFLTGALMAASLLTHRDRGNVLDRKAVVPVAPIEPEMAGEMMADGHRKKCPTILAPVCAADGVIYGNKCSAAADARYAIPNHVKVKSGDACDPNDASWIPLPTKPE